MLASFSVSRETSFSLIFAVLSLLVLCLAPVAVGFADAPNSRVGLAKEKPAEGQSVAVEGGYMVPYAVTIPGSDVSFEMIPIPAGSFKMGSPENEAGRSGDEGPQIDVSVDPMWVAKTEVTWAQYKEFMKLYLVFKEFEAAGERVVNDSNRVEAITAPTELYDSSYTYQYGEEPEQPAVTMTQYSAQQFTKWLSRITGQQYRLPTEAEWEYAARAQSRAAYSWGNSAAAIDDHAWYADNTDDALPIVGMKQPNAFGLHDMHGCVAEWTVNQYTEDGYERFATGGSIRALDVVKWPETSSPCVVRGGTWEMDPEQLRSAARLASADEQWKDADPNFPKSPWWYTDDPARGVGFRVFRSYKTLDREMIAKFWEPNAEDVKSDVESRLVEGRGCLGLVDPGLPHAIREMED